MPPRPALVPIPDHPTLALQPDDAGASGGRVVNDFWRNRPYAVDVAMDLLDRWGERALGIALDRRHSANLAGETAGFDLYQGVCTILADRNQVFTRWYAGRR